VTSQCVPIRPCELVVYQNALVVEDRCCVCCVQAPHPDIPVSLFPAATCDHRTYLAALIIGQISAVSVARATDGRRQSLKVWYFRPTVNQLSLPSLCHVADQLAGVNQRRYTSLLSIQLVATVLAAVLSQLGTLFPDASFRLEVASAVGLVVAIAVQVLTHVMDWNHAWFEDRAVAEASLSASWRFMLRCVPFEGPDVDAESFARALAQELPGGSAALRGTMTHLGDSAFHPTIAMVQLRESPWPARAELYREQRLDQQRQWYARKAQLNARGERGLWLATAGANVLAGGFLVLHVLNPTTNFVGVMTTLAAALLAWSNARRFGELSQTYRSLGNQLGAIGAQLEQCASEAELVAYVAAAEETMTHEHWIWVARRVKRHVGLPPLRRA